MCWFQFEINSAGGRDDDLPRLIYNANNTQFNFALDNFVPTFNKSRFALEMSVVANKSSHDMSVEETKSIDDEYSPGVFRVNLGPLFAADSELENGNMKGISMYFFYDC